ncbi:MAG: c-type cytochrome domain-containing protein [Pseudomonadota bacterium]
MSDRPRSALLYFACVTLVTAAGIATAMTFRPAFRHQVLDVLGLADVPQAAPGSFYTARVAPLFETRCNGCHGDKMDRGQLRLDSFALLMRGGKHGAVIAPGRVDGSELFRRITLPESDEQAMPPSGKPPLTKDDIIVIRLWIAAGASGALPVHAIKNAPKPVVEIEIPQSDPVQVHRQRAPLADVVRQLQVRFPGMLEYVSRDSADLEMNASLSGGTFGHAQLREFLPLQDRILRADLSGTAITDGAAPVLAAMTRLEVLRLANTKVAAATMQALAPLKSLRSVTVTGSAVPPAAVVALRQRGIVVYGSDDVR